MGAALALDAAMRTLGLLITLLTVSPQAISEQKPAVPEGTIITSAQVTGFEIDRLSPGLQQEIRSLPGTPLRERHLRELAARIEAERPNHVAAVRTVMDVGGEARVFFVVGRQNEPARDDNVNARYIVEHAEITGIPDAALTPALRDALAAAIGKRLDAPEVDRLRERIERDLSGYDVSRRIRRGSEPGKIRLIYELRKREPPAWLDFEALRSNVVFHSDHGWGSYLDLAFGSRNVRVTPILAFDNADDLVEEYSGYGVRLEARKLGTRRLGASFEWTRFEPDWDDATLNALPAAPGIPALYEKRTTVSPLVKFAVTPDLSVAAGVSISELEAFAPATGSQSANAFVTSIRFDRRWDGDTGERHQLDAAFGIRAGSTELESDLSYERYLGHAEYRFRFGRHEVQATGMAGGISGNAPLFERFTLGDSRTLRGWNKYDIAPLGGDRMFYSSVEYRYRGLALFLDTGSVWDSGAERRVRVSSGFGFHAGPAFLTVGFPLNTDDVTATVALGLRVQGIGARW
jgi:hypothetical protein